MQLKMPILEHRESDLRYTCRVPGILYCTSWLPFFRPSATHLALSLQLLLICCGLHWLAPKAHQSLQIQPLKIIKAHHLTFSGVWDLKTGGLGWPFLEAIIRDVSWSDSCLEVRWREGETCRFTGEALTGAGISSMLTHRSLHESVSGHVAGFPQSSESKWKWMNTPEESHYLAIIKSQKWHPLYFIC